MVAFLCEKNQTAACQIYHIMFSVLEKEGEKCEVTPLADFSCIG